MRGVMVIGYIVKSNIWFPEKGLVIKCQGRGFDRWKYVGSDVEYFDLKDQVQEIMQYFLNPLQPTEKELQLFNMLFDANLTQEDFRWLTEN